MGVVKRELEASVEGRGWGIMEWEKGVRKERGRRGAWRGKRGDVSGRK